MPGLPDDSAAAAPRVRAAPGQARAWGWWAALALVLLISAPYYPRFMNANERPRVLQGLAVVEDGAWFIDGPAARGVDPGIDVARGVGGRLLPNKPPGGSVPAVLAAAGLRAVGALGPATPTEVVLRRVTLLTRLLGAWLPTLMIAALALATIGAGRADPEPAATRLAVLSWALATPTLSYAHVHFGHTLAAALLFAGYVALESAAASGRWGARGGGRAVLGGACAAAAVSVDYLAVFAALPIAALLLRPLLPGGRARTAAHAQLPVERGVAGRVVLAALVGALLPIVLLALYQWRALGSPWATPYHRVVDPGFAEIHGRGLLGLTLPSAAGLREWWLSPWAGVWCWAPLAIAGLAPLVLRDADARARRHAAVLLLFVLLNLGLQQLGGWRVGPRYLVLALPFAIAGVRELVLWARRSPRGWAALVALVTMQALVQGLAARLFPHLPPAGNPLGELLWPLAFGGFAAPDLLAAWAGTPGCSGRLGLGVVPALLTGVGLTGAAIAVATPARLRRAAALGGAAGLVLALLAGLVGAGDPAAEPRLAAIERLLCPP